MKLKIDLENNCIIISKAKYPFPVKKIFKPKQGYNTMSFTISSSLIKGCYYLFKFVLVDFFIVYSPSNNNATVRFQ